MAWFNAQVISQTSEENDFHHCELFQVTLLLLKTLNQSFFKPRTSDFLAWSAFSMVPGLPGSANRVWREQFRQGLCLCGNTKRAS